jgi:hypothetical protein
MTHTHTRPQDKLEHTLTAHKTQTHTCRAIAYLAVPWVLACITNIGPEIIGHDAPAVATAALHPLVCLRLFLLLLLFRHLLLLVLLLLAVLLLQQELLLHKLLLQVCLLLLLLVLLLNLLQLKKLKQLGLVGYASAHSTHGATWLVLTLNNSSVL